MKTKEIVLPSLGLGIVLLLAAPGERIGATFTTTGESLGTSQRDVRVFDNFADAESNNNNVAHPMFPGQTGAELAIWKGIVEWGSLPHGDGSGDPVGGNVLGSGGANFDAAWMGVASAAGNADQNIVSTDNACPQGVLAYTLLPASNGWTIRFCDANVTFADGPGAIGASTWDIQGIMAHEYGHALGLGHSCTNAATMRPGGTAGQTALRSIHSDDIAGIQAVYGVASPLKPVICETSASGGTLTILGGNFDFTNNAVWFTNVNVTGQAADPHVIVTGVPSTLSGTRIDVAIPANAGPGDVLVKLPPAGGSSLSNAFPTDLVGTISANSICPITLTSVTPDPIPALLPGTAQEVTLIGTGLDQVTGVLFNLFTSVPASEWTIVNDTTITLNIPQHQFLGPNTLSVTDGVVQRDIGITIVETTGPKLELGTGDPFNENPDGSSMNVIVAGTPGHVHRIYYSPSPLPSIHPVASFDMGNGFSQFFYATSLSVQAKGFRQTSAPVSWTGAAMDFYCQSIDMTTFEVSNLQSIRLTP